MPEHWIRLRGGWQLQTDFGDAVVTRPVTLPIQWPDGQAGPVRLLRRFGCPPLDPLLHESVTLRLEKVPGLRAIHLNGRSLEGPLDAPLVLTRESIGPILAKNLLILEVDPAQATQPGEPWGQIALVVEASGGTEN